MVTQHVLSTDKRRIIGGYVKIREENLADLNFAKTSGNVTRARKKIDHFGSRSLLVF